MEGKYFLDGTNSNSLFKRKQNKQLFWGKGLQYDEEFTEMLLPYFDVVVEDHLDDYYVEKSAYQKQTEESYNMKSLVKSIETILAKSESNPGSVPRFGTYKDVPIQTSILSSNNFHDSEITPTPDGSGGTGGNSGNGIP